MKQITLLLTTLILSLGIVLPGQAQNCSADFTYAPTPNSAIPFQYTFTNTSTAQSGVGIYTMDISQIINPSTTQYIATLSMGTSGSALTYTFPGPGDYYVSLTVFDSVYGPPTTFCWDSTSYLINVPDPNEIKGYLIAADTALVNPSYDYKVWLIQYDSAQDWLYAVDSQTINSSDASTYYEFIGHPPGFYYVKAHEQSGQLNNNNEVMLPTYHLSSLSWANATQIAHGGMTTWASIQMLAGNSYSGSGFIGGNVSQGANRPTGEEDGVTGVVGLDVFLVDQHNPEALFFTSTDEHGDFTFEDIPVGTYEIYPEALNFSTTPIVVDISENNPVSDGNDFEQTTDEIRPKSPTGIHENQVVEFKLYPNPVTDQLTIKPAGKMKIVDIRIWDNQGRQAFHSMQPDHFIDLSGLADGLYYIRVTNASGGVQMQKFVKQSR